MAGVQLRAAIGNVAAVAERVASGPFPWKHLLAALLIREVLAPFTGHPYDFEIWVRLGKSMLSQPSPYVYLNYIPGLSLSPYPVLGSIAYLPLSAFVFGGTYAVYAALGEPSRYLYYFLLKQPMVIADVLVGWLLFHIISITKSSDSARRAALIWLYIPFSIITSTLWGSLDSVVLFLVLLSVYLFQKGRFGSSALALAFSIFYKQNSLVFLPVFLLQKRISLKQKAVFCLVTIAIPGGGTVIPAVLFHWPALNMYNNFAWQTVLPVIGAMSIFDPLVVVPNVPSIMSTVLGSLWIPLVLLSYYVIWRRRTSLVEGMLFSFLAFCVLRPFLPETWTGYALTFLLIIGTKVSYLRFVALATAAQLFLVTNNTLLIRFFTPISLNYFNWDLYLNNSILADPRFILMFFFAVLYFVETVDILFDRPSYLGGFGPFRRIADWMTPPEAI